MDSKEENDQRYNQFKRLVDCLTRKNVINDNQQQAILKDQDVE